MARPPPALSVVPKSHHNLEVAQRLREASELLDLQGADRFRVTAFSNAAKRVAKLNEDVMDLARREQDLRKRISALYATAATLLSSPRGGKKARAVRADHAVPFLLNGICQIPLSASALNSLALFGLFADDDTNLLGIGLPGCD